MISETLCIKEWYVAFKMIWKRFQIIIIFSSVQFINTLISCKVWCLSNCGWDINYSTIDSVQTNLVFAYLFIQKLYQKSFVNKCWLILAKNSIKIVGRRNKSIKEIKVRWLCEVHKYVNVRILMNSSVFILRYSILFDKVTTKSGRIPFLV